MLLRSATSPLLTVSEKLQVKVRSGCVLVRASEDAQFRTVRATCSNKIVGDPFTATVQDGCA